MLDVMGSLRRGCALAWVLLGCTSALDFDEECQTNGACASLGEGLVCVAGKCVLGTPLGDGGTPRDVAVQPAPDARVPSVEGLLREGCTVVGPAGADAVRMIGALVPDAEPGQSEARAGLTLAVDEINAAGGLGGPALALLLCPERPRDAVRIAQRVAQMAEVLDVPAIIGPSDSQFTAKAYADGAQPFGLLMLAPTSADLEDAGHALLWTLRTDVRQAARAAAELARAGGAERVAIIARDDAWGGLLADIVAERFCESPSCAAAERYSFAPFSAEVIEVVEAAAMTAPDRVITVARPLDFLNLNAALADAALTRTTAVEGPISARELGAFLSLDDQGETRLPDWRFAQRQSFLCGSASLNATQRGPAWPGWAERFRASFPEIESSPRASIYFDAVFSLAYAIATVGDGEVTGEALSAGFGRLIEGAPVRVGGEGWTAGLAALQRGTIDLEGASGSLLFDVERRAVRGAVDAWWYDGTADGVAAGGTVIDAQGRFTAPRPRPPCDE